MREEEPRRSEPMMPRDWHKLLPAEADASSDGLGWVGLEALRCRTAPAFELNPPAITHHRLVLFIRPPEEFVPVPGPHRVTASRLFFSHHLCLPDESGRWHRLIVCISA